jgi:hypothetical protein
MKTSILTNKRLLGIDGEVDFLLNLENEILCACPECQFDKATSFEDARELILLMTYDLTILDIVKAPGVKLVDLIVSRNFPVLTLSDRCTFQNGHHQCEGLKICGFLPKAELHHTASIVGDALAFGRMPRWRRVLQKYGAKTTWLLSEALMVQNSLDNRFPAKSDFFYY